MKLLPFALSLTLASLSASASAASPAQPDQLRAAVQAALAGCGVKPALSVPLGQAAADLLASYELGKALERQNYRPHNAQGWTATYHGDLNWVRRTLAQQCGKWQGYAEYGLATDGTRMGMVLATAARVDLTQSRRWLNDFLAATNRARSQGQKCGGKLMNATGPLKWDTRLEAAAARHARDMVRFDFRGHTNPKDGSDPLERAKGYGFRGSVGENIQYGSITAAEAVKHLLTSPGHCENLMRPEWKLFGAAVNNGTSKTLFPTYWVQVFGAE
ncbi:MAG: CAP domain-containing protein [Deinococcus sp.]|uniref:CAP domain-containing protein n=1 Tax=Deinococcus sp. TaxID=47478 RepID=UPI0026DDB1F2|nr:CAP domain-containing protein [Deinococcus sp.]MDO4246762.1 CAP domain-containing protein [Deinococcus sp.]